MGEEIRIFIEKSSSAICIGCGELGFFVQVWLLRDPGNKTRSEFFCPACGQNVGRTLGGDNDSMSSD